MYNIGVGVALPATTAGASLMHNSVGQAAGAALPFTGAAFGLYLAVGLSLFLVGLVMQLLGHRGATGGV